MSRKVSVIITCYNYGQYLDEALDSVYNSNYDNFEVIIVNDGSDDINTIDKLNDIKKRGYKNLSILDQDNSGVVKARNNGFKLSTGGYVVFLDADDKIDRNYISKCAQALDSNPSISFVYTDSIFFNEKKQVKIFNLEYNFYSLLFRNYIPITSMIRREAFSSVGGYKQCNYEDWELYINLAENGFIGYYLNEYLFFYRIHGNSKQKKDDIDKEKNILQIKDIHKDLYNKETLKKIKEESYKDNLDFIKKEIFRIVRAIIIRYRVKLVMY